MLVSNDLLQLQPGTGVLGLVYVLCLRHCEGELLSARTEQ